MLQYDITNSTARILYDDSSNDVAGVGFFLSPTHIVTCAHVIADVLNLPSNLSKIPDNIIIIDFPLIGGQPKYQAKLLKIYPVKEKAVIGDLEDIAILEIIDSNQNLVKPVPLVYLEPHLYYDRKVRILGFTEKMKDGLYINGILEGLTGTGWVQINVGAGLVTPGFSGAPVWDKQEAGVVGMVVRYFSLTGIQNLYMIPSSIIYKSFPEMESHRRFDITSTVYMSYAKEDREIASNINRDLKSAGINLWMDTERILPGMDWSLEIKKAIKESDYFLILLSKNSISKQGYIQKELKIAYEIFDSLPVFEKFIIPIRLEDINIKDERLNGIMALDLFSDYDKGIDKLIKSIIFKRKGIESPIFYNNDQEPNIIQEANIIDDESKIVGINIENLIINKPSELETLINQMSDTNTLELKSKKLVSEIPVVIKKLRHIKNLVLRNLNLTELPEEIFQLDNLETIDLSDNLLTEIPAIPTKPYQIKKINLSNNKLVSLPYIISEFCQIEELILSGNEISNIPKFIVNLKKLRLVDFSSNKIKAFPLEFYELNNIEILRLNRNLLEEFNDKFRTFKGIKHIECRGNVFNELPIQLSEMMELKVIDFDSNKIIKLPDFIWRLKNLERLDLSNNRIKEIHNKIDNPLPLRELILANNELSELPIKFGNLSNLRLLNLENNKIHFLPETFEKLINIETINLNNNYLLAFPLSLCKLSNLRTLDLQNNSITVLPDEIENLKSLEKMYLSNNPLPLPPEMIKDIVSPLEISEYLKNAKIPLNEAKIIVVGQPSVGKTSLIKRLTNDEYDKKERTTPGVNITPWLLNFEGKKIKLNFWDFGGQEIMHATHQIFLTKRSIYILVLDSRLDEQSNRLFYWMQLIKSYGGNAPILITCNKSDEALLELDWSDIQNKYPTIGFVKRLSCETGDGLSKVKDKIIQLTKKLPHLKDPVPVKWLKVKSSLEEIRSGKDYISFRNYQKLCSKNGIIENSAQRSLIAFMHDLGVVLHYQGYRTIEDTSVLNPEWVTKGIYNILNSHLLFEKYGMLNIDDLDHILDENIYPKDKQNFIIEMMKHFELCFELPILTGKRLLIPDLLRKQSPYTGDWKDALLLRYDYKVLPTSIISRFIVRLHEYIKDETYWRTGVVLEIKDRINENIALVKADLANNQIKIFVSGSKQTRRESLRIIRESLDRINESIPNLQVDMKVPIYDSPDIAVGYDHLLMLEEQEQENCWPEGMAYPVKVKKLLNGIITEDRRIDERETKRSEKKEKKIGADIMLNNPVRILHLSDLHVNSGTDINALLQPLFADIEDKIDGLGIDVINLIIITGDFTNCASPNEFEKAAEFCSAIKKRYSVTNNNFIIVPGNHDLDWDENVYERKPIRKVDTSALDSAKYVEEGKGILIRLDDSYPNKFKNFSDYLHMPLLDKKYQLSFDQQSIPFFFSEYKILILAMNSCWEIDEFFEDRSGIHSSGLSTGLLEAENKIKKAKEDGVLNSEDTIMKIACWHHPVTGNEKIVNDAFMERIQKADFKLCLHGHVHEERSDLFGYLHPTRKLHVVGAGSFDAISKNRPESIPRIYNLLEIDSENGLIRVHTRCKMKQTGAWTGWAVWSEEQHTKKTYYDIKYL